MNSSQIEAAHDRQYVTPTTKTIAIGVVHSFTEQSLN